MTYNDMMALRAAMGTAESSIRDIDGKTIPLFEFECVNKIVPISSIYRDFPKSISKGIKEMAKNEEIKPLECYGNAYLVAQYLIENGYEQVRLVDGLYRDLRNVRWGEDTHRFIQYTNPNGRTRYYDPTMEIIPTTSQTWSWEYTALRVFEPSEIERFKELSNNEVAVYRAHYDLPYDENCFGYGSTLDNNKYRTCDMSVFQMPFINDNGEYVGVFSQQEVWDSYLQMKASAA